MSDFHQSGPVTALPLLVKRPVEEMERRIQTLTRRFPVALVIPMIPSEMDRPALAGILGELCRVSYLDTLLVSLNKATAEDHARATEFFGRYPGRKVILWNEAPAVEAFVRPGLRVDPHPVRHTSHPTFGYLITDGRVQVAWAPEFLEFPAWAAGWQNV